MASVALLLPWGSETLIGLGRSPEAVIARWPRTGSRWAGPSSTLTHRCRTGEREAPDDLVVLLSLSFEPEAGLLEDAVRGVALRQRVGDHRRDPLVGERLREHRPRRRRGETAPPPRFGDLESDLDDTVFRRTFETAPADQLRRISCHEKASAPGRSAWVRGKGIAGGLQRLGKRRPAGDDVVAERFCEHVVTRQRGLHQRELGTDETDHGGQLLTRLARRAGVSATAQHARNGRSAGARAGHARRLLVVEREPARSRWRRLPSYDSGSQRDEELSRQLSDDRAASGDLRSPRQQPGGRDGTGRRTARSGPGRSGSLRLPCP